MRIWQKHSWPYSICDHYYKLVAFPIFFLFHFKFLDPYVSSGVWRCQQRFFNLYFKYFFYAQGFVPMKSCEAGHVCLDPTKESSNLASTNKKIQNCKTLFSQFSFSPRENQVDIGTQIIKYVRTISPCVVVMYSTRSLSFP